MSALSQTAHGVDAASASTRMPRRLAILTAITIISLIAGLVLALVIVRPDIDQGNVQRIFYIHMPSFFGAFVAFGGAVIGGIGYLRTRNLRWDALAVAGVEVGLVFSLINLLTGAIWAKPTWNVWWTWDPRLTSAAVMALTYAAYLMLRNAIENPNQRRRFAAIYGIIAFATVLYTLIIIRIRPDTIHPTIIGASPTNAEGTFEATTSTAIALVPNLFIWGFLLPITIMWHRIRLQNVLERLAMRRAEINAE